MLKMIHGKVSGCEQNRDMGPGPLSQENRDTGPDHLSQENRGTVTEHLSPNNQDTGTVPLPSNGMSMKTEKQPDNRVAAGLEMKAETLDWQESAYYRIRDAKFPAPFPARLEYNSPAHGTWNIVHIGMLIPQSHQIYICTGNCNRGVVLTAAEMNASDRFSTITVQEENVLEGDMEELIIDGVTDILEHLPRMPRNVLLFPSCVHRFLGTDIPMVYRILRERFPQVDFTEGFMDCILQKAGLPPDQRLRRELYSALRPRKLNRKSVNLIGNTMKLDRDNELCGLLEQAGCTFRQLTTCETYEDFLDMGESYLNLTVLPIGKMPAEKLKDRLGMKHLYLPQCFGYEEIRTHLHTLAEELGIEECEEPNWEERIAGCDAALQHAKEIIGDTPIAIDHTAVPRPLGLARLLISHGFRVIRVYADAFVPEEKEDFLWLQAHAPELVIYATIHVQMRVISREYPEKVLAIGQKAAYFTSTPYFVNMVEGGGLYGFAGICRLAAMMEEAYLNEKDTEDLVIRKGLGCESVI